MRKNIIKGLLLVLVAVFFTACSGDGAPAGYRRIYDKALIGYYVLHHKLHDGTPVFLVGTPRGLEYCVGRDNLQWSLDTYRENGMYGKPYEGDDTSEAK